MEHRLRPSLPFKRDVGIVFQNYALFPHMTVAKNIGYGLRMRSVSKAEIIDASVKSWSWSSCPHMAIACRANYPAGSNSASPLLGRWSSDPKSFCWMSLFRRSTRICGRQCRWS